MFFYHLEREINILYNKLFYNLSEVIINNRIGERNMDKFSRRRLNNGLEMPIIGQGTALAKKWRKIKRIIPWALDNGFRLIDTALVYGNEKHIGKALTKYFKNNSTSLNREDIFITTKLPNSKHGYENTKKAFEKSLKNLRLEYVDLYLIHWPVPEKSIESWRAMEEIYKSGKAKAIGVSNFLVPHLRKLIEKASIKPMIDQVEFNPFNYRRKLMEYCRENNIQLEAYTPLARTDKLSNPVLQNIAETRNKTGAQIILRWHIQKEVIPIPFSSNQTHIQQNLDIFDFKLSEEEMKKIDGLNENYIHEFFEPDWFPALDWWENK